MTIAAADGTSSRTILTLLRLPARLDSGQTATLLGFKGDDIQPLVRAKLLKPLGNPPPNSVKYFASVQIQELAHNPDWLARATLVVARHRKEKNRNRIAHRKMAPTEIRHAEGALANQPEYDGRFQQLLDMARDGNEAAIGDLWLEYYGFEFSEPPNPRTRP